jgi:TonB family protein
MKCRKTWPVCLLSLTLCCTVARADDRRLIEKELRKTYDNYALSLKIPYASENLHFDSKGQFVGSSPLGVWTTSGILQVGKIVLKPNVLQINGNRILVALRASQGSSILVPIVTARSVHITIELESTTSNIDQLNQVIERVFQKQDTRKRIAAYWRPVPEDQASATFPAGAQVTGMLEGNRPVYGRLAGIVPPKPVHMEAPTFTQSAREKRLQGTAVVSVVVNEKGLPEILEVTKDPGEGLDIQSLLTVAEWRFRPATLNGQPVAVQISVEVSFRLF